MTEREYSLTERLESYPHLKEALGDEWIAREEGVDPVMSAYRLARWLRLDGFARDLAILDHVLGQLCDVPRFGDRRTRIRNDAPALMETLTELYFGAWLKSQGFEFEWTKAGPDFAIHIGADQPLLLEATSPRKAAWSQDLLERLHLISLRAGFSVDLDYSIENFDSCTSEDRTENFVRSVEMLPDPANSESLVSAISASSQEELLKARQQSNVQTVIQRFPEIGFVVKWTRSDHPHFAEITSPGPTSPYTVAWHVVDAARKKDRQMPKDKPGILLIGTRQLPTLSKEHFFDALRYYPPEAMSFLWAELPNQVKHLIFYSLSLRQIAPSEGYWIENPASSLVDGPNTHAFLRALFPHPFLPADNG